MKNKKIIISGPPSSGKSTIIHKLKTMGEICCEEIGPIDIEDENIKNSKIQLSEFIFQKREGQYLQEHTKPCFYDRSMIDVIAYLDYWNIKPPKHWNELMQKYRYNKTIFYTPLWSEIYQNSNARPESYIEARNIDVMLKKTYINFHYNIIEVPKLGINKRIEFIINNI
jgi:predicted ATPase